MCIRYENPTQLSSGSTFTPHDLSLSFFFVFLFFCFYSPSIKEILSKIRLSLIMGDIIVESRIWTLIPLIISKGIMMWPTTSKGFPHHCFFF